MAVAKMYQRVVIVDPSLEHQHSHNFRYVEALRQKYPNSEVLLYCAKSFSGGLSGVTIRRHFDVNIYDQQAFVRGSNTGESPENLRKSAAKILDILKHLGLPGQLLVNLAIGSLNLTRKTVNFFSRMLSFNRADYQTNDKLAEQIFFALSKSGLTHQDLVVYPTALGSLLESMITVKVKNGFQNFPCKAIYIFHFDYRDYSNGYHTFASKRADKRIAENLPFQGNLFCATNERLSKLFEQDLNLKCTVIQDLVSELNFINPRTQKSSDEFNILVPGKYMWDKNFGSVPDIIKTLRSQNISVTFHESVLQHIYIEEGDLDLVNIYKEVPSNEEWLSFLSSFDALILPYGDKYRFRISGILSEAKLLKVPCIVSSVCADADRVNPGLVYYSPEQLLDIVNAVRQNTFSDSELFVPSKHLTFEEVVEEDDLFYKGTNKPLAIQIKPAWYRCGSSTVFDNQLEYLIDNGYFVIEVLVRNIFWNSSKEQVAEAFELLKENRRYYGGALAYFVRPNPSLFHIFTWLLNLRKLITSGSIGRYHYLMNTIGLPQILKNIIKSNEIPLVVCNHVYHLGLAKRFDACFTVCETHDIQSRQYQVRGELPDEFAYNKSIDEELNILNEESDALVNISAYENFFYENRVNKPSYLCKPYRESTVGSTNYRDLASLLRDNLNDDLYNSQQYYLDGLSRISMFFVGDAHEANIQSLTWFVEDVLPLLEGQSLFVGGTISKHLKKCYRDHKQLVHLGYIKDLANIYDFVEVAILPDREGAGIPIKTIEVFSQHCAFVATSKALRGIDYSSFEFKPTNDARDFADDILRLIDNAEEKQAREKVSASMANAFSKESYYDTWDKVIENGKHVN